MQIGPDGIFRYKNEIEKWTVKSKMWEVRSEKWEVRSEKLKVRSRSEKWEEGNWKLKIEKWNAKSEKEMRTYVVDNSLFSFDCGLTYCILHTKILHISAKSLSTGSSKNKIMIFPGYMVW